MSIRKLAKELGLSVAQTHKLTKRGMPADPEAARAWRKVNIPNTKGRHAIALPELQRDLKETKAKADAKLPESLAEAERIFRDLEAACDAATARAAQLAGNTAPAIDELGRRWSSLAADLLARKLAVVERVQALRLQSGELMLASEAREVFGAFLRDMRRYAETLPSSMSIRCNPVDPELARSALEEWLSGYFSRLHRNGAEDVASANS